MELVRRTLSEGNRVLLAVEQDTAIHARMDQIARLIAEAMQRGNKLMVAGNGGSAADAQHMAAEFVVWLVKDRPPMRAMALTTNTSVLTAVSNDYGYERSIARQVEAHGQAGDVFLGISTSGVSANVIAALEQSRKMGVVTIGLTGGTGGAMPKLCDYLVTVPSTVTMYIQQAHLALEHIYCLLTEKYYFGSGADAAETPVAKEA